MKRALYEVLKSFDRFCDLGGGLKLRRYQLEAAQAIVKSVRLGLGQTIVVQFPRQSGKNELQAHLEAYFLRLFCDLSGEIVKVSPTMRPQSLNAMRRLERVLEKNVATTCGWQKESGYIYRIKSARVYFLSGEPSSNVVGATASSLLVCDEAQDVMVSKWDKDFNPMAASTNATRVFWGTAWTSRTLLARELRAAREMEKKDGKRRVFAISALEVAREVPAYGQFVAEQTERLGRNHPLVRTQFYSEEIDSESGMFPPERQALMQGAHLRLQGPEDGKQYAILVDVAGEDENWQSQSSVEAGGVELANRGRDATALTVVEIGLESLRDPLLKAPTYRVVDRRRWLGVKHTSLYGVITGLAEHWRAKHIVVDATGVGAGLASFLTRALPDRVTPFLFTSGTKSSLGWDFLAVVETGRFQDWQDPLDGRKDERWEFWRELQFCEMEALPGHERRLKWGVPDGSRDPQTGETVHDDLLISASLCAVLDRFEWSYGEARSVIIPPVDPL
jgi:hypothetical protein